MKFSIWFALVFSLLNINLTFAQDSLSTQKLNEEVFQNLSTKPTDKSITISWSMNYDDLTYLIENHYSLLIKYNTDLGDKRHKSGYANSDWTVIKNLDIKKTSYTIKNLSGGEKYVYKIGLKRGKEEIWSEKGKVETDQPWGLFKFLVLIGALGMFIYGMKIMSEGLQQAAGSRLRNLLGSITSNRVKGVLTGFGITSIVQSSSVTTVMTVSFVNAGLMTLMQSAGVMMGANIGTTITGWLINIFGFKVNIGAYALVFIAIGAPFLFIGKKKIKA